tara:strand:+ start:382 stop:573 length:192 start_codon:yes stop_codon:yes gene_type:complete
MSGINGEKIAGGGSRLSLPLSDTIVNTLMKITMMMLAQAPIMTAEKIEAINGVKIWLSVTYQY